MKKFRSITTKVLILSLITSTLITAILVSISFFMTKRTFEKLHRDEAIRDSKIYSQYIGNWFEERKKEIETYSHDKNIKSMDWDTVEPYLREELNRKDNIYYFFGLADKEGNYNTTMERNPGNVSHREYFQKAMKGEVLVTGPVISQSTGKDIFSIIAPVKNDAGEVIGMLGGAITLDNLYKFIEDFKVDHRDSYSYIFDKNGLIITHPDPSIILNENIISDLNITDEFTGKRIDELFRTQENGVMKYEFRGVNSYGYFHGIPNTDGWRIMTKIPQEYLTLPIRDINRMLILVGLLGVVLSALLSGFTAKTISSPIIKLKDFIIETTQKNFIKKAAVESNDEVGTLTESFNHMIDVIGELTYYDLLTGLPGRKIFEEQLELAIAHCIRNDENLAVMIIGIDKFKYVNDAFGHTVGDEVLRRISERIQGKLRPEDILCRITGDEFAVFFSEGQNEKQVIKIVEHILREIKNPYKAGKKDIYITASVGLAFYPKDGDNREALIKNANIALHRAKEMGGGGYRLYNDSMKEELLEQIEIENMMARAMKNQEFHLNYQPIIDFKTLEIIGMEALVRWEHPILGMIPPYKFIPIAEENGTIIQLGKWVLKEACIQNKKWQDKGLKKIFVAVNVSMRQFQDQNFVNMIKETLEETGLNPKYLGLEITESIAMENEDFALDVLKKLKDMGVYVAIDDFGTGYSSLGYLNKFPIDSLKIDKSFIMNLSGEGSDGTIASTIIAMGHNLRLKITAEGVETKEQLAYLQKQQCDTLQGYLFSKPVNGDEFEKILERNTYSEIATTLG